MRSLTTIGFDADDTLWHTERTFRLTEARFAELLAEYGDADGLSRRLLETEKRNLQFYGFGWGTFIPHPLTWALEQADAPAGAPRFRQLESIVELPNLLAEIDRGA